MEPVVTAAVAALITAMTTDAWGRAKLAVVRLLGRGGQEPGSVDAELERARELVLEARRHGDVQAERDVVVELTRRLEAVLGTGQAPPEVCPAGSGVSIAHQVNLGPEQTGFGNVQIIG